MNESKNSKPGKDKTARAEYPFVAIVPADEPGKPSGAARVRRLLKELGRRHRVRIEWQPKIAGSDTGSDTRSTAKTASRGKHGSCETSEADMASDGGKYPKTAGNPARKTR